MSDQYINSNQAVNPIQGRREEDKGSSGFVNGAIAGTVLGAAQAGYHVKTSKNPDTKKNKGKVIALGAALGAAEGGIFWGIMDGIMGGWND